MRGVFLDFLFPNGHQRFSSKMLNMLSQFSTLTVLAKKGYYNQADLNGNIELIENKKFHIKAGALKGRLSSLYIMMKSAFYTNRTSYNYCFVTSFDTISFAIGVLFYKNKRNIYVVHHNNVDELSNSLKRSIFKLYMNKVNHIVLEEFIGEHLVNVSGVDLKRVFCIPHPLDDTDLSYEEQIYSCCALSNSNDERVVLDILAHEEKNEDFKINKQEVILKSKTTEYSNGYLKLLKGYLNRADYDNYLIKSKAVLLPFPSTYLYRMSGVLIDALSRKKFVIGTDIPILRYYKEIYPSLCTIISDGSQLADCLNKTTSFSDEEYAHFISKHSNQNITARLKSILS